MPPICGTITWKIRNSEEGMSMWRHFRNIDQSFAFLANVSFNNLWKEAEPYAEVSVNNTLEMILLGVYGAEVESIVVSVDFSLLEEVLEQQMQCQQLSVNQLLESLGVFSAITLPKDILLAGDSVQEFSPRARFSDYIPDLGYGPLKGYSNAPQFLAEARRRERAKARAKSRKRRKRRSGLKRARYLAKRSKGH